MRIALDAMGGDDAPCQNIAGLRLALADFAEVERFLVVGDEVRIARDLGELAGHPRVEIVHADEVIEMNEAATAVRRKRKSSIAVCARLIKEGRADAIVSAGHTGASVASTVLTNRMLPGIDRPGIASVFPSPNGFFVLLDIGANVDCKPKNLAHYAILGEAYSRLVLGVERPRVGMLSIGGEDGKGNELTKNSSKLLARMPVNFIGNVEGRDLFEGTVDVVVCDGFVGNVVLKCCEGMAKAISGILKENLRKTPIRRAGALLSKRAFGELKELIDHEEYGGAPLLGINGICIIAHGSSSPRAIRNAIRVASQMIQHEFNNYIKDTIATIDWDPSESAAPE
jgi:glycerol-3-phosphate acyltransferase PlsX